MKTKALSYKSFFYGTILIIVLLAYLVFTSCSPLYVVQSPCKAIVMEKNFSHGREASYWLTSLDTVNAGQTLYILDKEFIANECDTVSVAFNERGIPYFNPKSN